MDSERTPLVMRSGTGPASWQHPRRDRPADVLRRFIKVSVLCTLIFICLSAVYHAARVWHHDSWHHHHHQSHDWIYDQTPSFSQEQLRSIMLDTPSPENLEKWSRHVSSGPHLAGKNRSLAAWTRDRWNEWGIESHLAPYDVYLNYPLDHSLSLLEAEDNEAVAENKWKVRFRASLEEDVLEEDPTTGLEGRIPTFHGYSANGDVTAPFVYVNYGTFQDFQDLVDAGVPLKGKIAVARYFGGLFRGLKVKRAQELGMVGCIMYTDPGEDGELTEDNGYKPYPEGPARNPHSVQRGSVSFLSQLPGDPTTPGYPSNRGVPRLSPVDNIPSIPSIPISYADAIPILKALNGHGLKASDMNRYWTRNTGLASKGVDYNVGPSPDSLVLHLYNQQAYDITPIWNVIGVINGTIPDEVVVVGNHRDAWIAGGAADPGSGSAVLNEVARSLGRALDMGWKPLRTIVLASWDGEEYNMLGSTEWVEDHVPWLSGAAVVYLNTDVACQGTHLKVNASPILHDVIDQVLQTVLSPNQTVPGQTVYDLFSGSNGLVGSSSDYTAFQDFIGIPIADFGFTYSGSPPVYHYHSNYDSFHWMKKLVDPDFTYHLALTRILGLILLEVSDKPVIPFNAADYALALRDFVATARRKLLPKDSAAKFPSSNDDEGSGDVDDAAELLALRASPSAGPAVGHVNDLLDAMSSLDATIDDFHVKALVFDARAARTAADLAKGGPPWWHMRKWWRLRKAIWETNRGYKFLDREFLYQEGLDGRSWFKHVVFAPGRWTGYSGAGLPGLVESVEDLDFDNGVKWARIIGDCVRRAERVVAITD